MFVDSRQLPDGHLIDADLCIVGAGAAGIPLARTFLGTGLRVAVLEGGGLEPDQATQDLNAGEIVDSHHSSPLTNRLRMFGGTTGHWGGRVRPLDPIDFEPRAAVPMSGWPFRYDTLAPYYDQANRVVEVGPPLYDAPRELASRLGRTIDFDDDRVRTFLFQFSPPTRFGEAFRAELVQAPNVAVYLYANVTGLAADADADMVERARFATLDGKRFEASARHFVLATGGLEVPRLLLLSDDVAAAGLGNQNDLVGRFYMTHLTLFPNAYGLVAAPRFDRSIFDWALRHDGHQYQAAIGPTPAMLERLSLGNFRATINPHGRSGTGRGSVKKIVRTLGNAEWPDELGRHFGNIIRDLDDLGTSFWRRLMNRDLDPPPPPIMEYSLHMSAEQVPNRDSRVRLSDRRDALGMRRIAVEWRLSETDWRTAIEGTTFLLDELGRNDFGRGRPAWDTPEEWLAFEGSGNHHMGGTRMADDPKRGVVDSDCRVHGIANLYVAGSSVFPTGGFTNPTLTIIALALRLGDHLKRIYA